MMDVSDSTTDCGSTVDVRARRRKLHTEAEQRRRDAIKGSRIQNQKRMEIEMLRKKVQALKIIKSSYERMSSESSYTTENEDAAITEQYKLQLFQLFMESLFQSFDAAVTESTFTGLSDQIVNWLENSCKPELLHQTMEHLLDTTLQDGYDGSHPQSQGVQHQQTPFQHQPQSTLFEAQTATDCPGQHQRIPNSYRRHSLKLSNSLEAVHESPFLISDSLNVSDHYQQSSGCQHVVFNPSNAFESSHPVYSDQPQHLQSGYVRSQPFQMHNYQSSDESGMTGSSSGNNNNNNKFSSDMPSTSVQRHSSVTPPSTSSVFQRSPGSNGMTSSRSLVVNSSLPAQNFGVAPSYIPPQQEGVYVSPQVQYSTRNNSGGHMMLPSGPFTKQSPF